MKLEDIERLSGMTITFGLVIFAVLLLDNASPWYKVLPILIILVGSCLMWRVKTAQHTIDRFRKKREGKCQNFKMD